jgi:hypothetical protein
MSRDRNLDLRGLDVWITGERTFNTEPPRVPVTSFAEAEDIQRSCELIRSYTDLFGSVVAENAKIFERGVRDVIAAHNDSVPITKTMRPTAFPAMLADLLDDFLRGLNDLSSDTQGDLERALDE